MRFRLIPLLAAGALVVPAPAHADHLRLGDRTLVRGHEGSDVEQLQRLLSRVGLPTAADGAFGRQTHRSVHRYERRHDLGVDGRVSRGQARGLLRRAGRPVPPGFGLPRTARADPPAAPPGFPVAGDVRWADGFGARGGAHRGVDLFGRCGLAIVATGDGTVRRVGSEARAGRHVVLRTAAGPDDVYMHMDTVEVAAGQAVRAGQRLGTLGDSGNATGCHLHFERWTAPGWHEGGEPVDPEPALRSAQETRARVD